MPIWETGVFNLAGRGGGGGGVRGGTKLPRETPLQPNLSVVAGSAK